MVAISESFREKMSTLLIKTLPEDSLSSAPIMFKSVDLPLPDGSCNKLALFYRQVYTAKRHDPACSRLEHLDHVFDLHDGRVAFIAAAAPIPTLSTL
jgi:hypothetical protein